MAIIGDIWNLIIIQPMVNSLALLYSILFSNFGLAIIVFTFIIRSAMIPLTLKQTRQMRAMSGMQPKLKEIQARYANDRQRLSAETLKMYRENGVNPIGCIGPLVLQMPIFIGLFQALRATLPTTPEALVNLSDKLYSWVPLVNQNIPFDSSFLWLDLAKPDPSPLILPILVGASTWFTQKMTTMPSADARQASTNRLMLWMMPVFLGFITLQFESGLALYWVASNIVGAVIQGFVMGWGPLITLFKPQSAAEPADAPALSPSTEETVIDADDRNDGQNTRRSNRDRSKRARRRTRGGRNRRR